MCGGGGDTPEVKPSQSEVLAGREGVDKWNERQDDGYVQLEQDAITDASRDHSNMLQGRASADLAGQTGLAYQAAANTGSAFALGNTANVASAANSQGMNAALQANQTVNDQKKLGVIQTGQDVTKSNDGILSSQVNRQLQSSISDVQNDIMVSNAKTQAIMDVVGTGVGLYASGAFKAKPDPRYSTGTMSNGKKHYGIGM